MNRILLIGGVGDGFVTDCLPGSATVVFNTPEGTSIYECHSARFVIAGHRMNMLVGIEHTAPKDMTFRMIARGLFIGAVADEISEERIEVTPISGIRGATGLGRGVDQ